MWIDLKKPSTITAEKEEAGAVQMIDKFGRLWYFRPQMKAGLFKFNQPYAGRFFCRGFTPVKIEPLSHIRYDIDLPKFERENNPELKSIEAGLIGHSPALVFAKQGRVIIDKEKFAKMPPPVRLFVLLHEMGHRHYTTEHYCDIFALKKFLEMGFNPSTAFLSLSRILDTKEGKRGTANTARIKQLFELIKKHSYA